MSLAKAKELRQERASLITQAGEILAREEEEDRNLSEDELQTWQRYHEEADQLKEKIDRLEKQEATEGGLSDPAEPRTGRPDPEGDPTAGSPQEDEEKRRKELEHRAFWKYLRRGMGALEPEERTAMQRRQQSLDLQKIAPEARALAVGTDASGGFTVPEGFSEQLAEAEKQFGGIFRSRAEIINTEDGRDLPWPTVDDTGNKGALLSENTQISEQDMTFSRVVFEAYMYTSKLIRVPFQLLEDSAFDLETWLPRKLGERVGRIVSEHMTTGTGTNQPNGVVTASAKGADAATADGYTYDDFVQLEASIDPAYLMNAEWMLSQTGIREAKRIKDGDGRPIWTPGMATREPDTILGYPYVVNQDMAAPATTAKSLLLGDFSLYKIRSVRDVQVLVLRERYADFLQIGIFAFARRDGDLVDAGTNPVKHLLHP